MGIGRDRLDRDRNGKRQAASEKKQRKGYDVSNPRLLGKQSQTVRYASLGHEVCSPRP
jgi:hypothetical protein